MVRGFVAVVVWAVAELLAELVVRVVPVALEGA